VRVVGYTRISTDDQAANGVGLEAQREAITAEAVRRGWHLVAVYEDAGASGKSVEGRPGLVEALAAVESGDAAAIVVSKLDRLSRSLLDFASLMERSRKRGWALVALDLQIDTTTPAGEMMASIMATFAQYERRLIGQRTREALAVKKTQGVQLGRPRALDPRIRRRIGRERTAGKTLQAIADALNAQGVPTAQGGKRWYAATVRKVLQSHP
jgi:DNA invertase Pin-like site-specific DNA recombinase